MKCKNCGHEIPEHEIQSEAGRLAVAKRRRVRELTHDDALKMVEARRRKGGYGHGL